MSDLKSIQWGGVEWNTLQCLSFRNEVEKTLSNGFASIGIDLPTTEKTLKCVGNIWVRLNSSAIEGYILESSIYTGYSHIALANKYVIQSKNKSYVDINIPITVEFQANDTKRIICDLYLNNYDVPDAALSKTVKITTQLLCFTT